MIHEISCSVCGTKQAGVWYAMLTQDWCGNCVPPEFKQQADKKKALRSVNYASPLAETIMTAMIRESDQPQYTVALNCFHVKAGLTPDEFERGLSWLIHFNYVEKFVEHSAVYIRTTK